jgi:hypothetical protein
MASQTGMNRPCIHPERPGIDKRIFNALKMNEKEGLDAVAHQHPFAEDHR